MPDLRKPDFLEKSLTLHDLKVLMIQTYYKITFVTEN